MQQPNGSFDQEHLREENNRAKPGKSRLAARIVALAVGTAAAVGGIVAHQKSSDISHATSVSEIEDAKNMAKLQAKYSSAHSEELTGMEWEDVIKKLNPKTLKTIRDNVDDLVIRNDGSDLLFVVHYYEGSDGGMMGNFKSAKEYLESSGLTFPDINEIGTYYSPDISENYRVWGTVNWENREDVFLYGNDWRARHEYERGIRKLGPADAPDIKHILDQKQRIVGVARVEGPGMEK